jgi:hypothetical protein
MNTILQLSTTLRRSLSRIALAAVAISALSGPALAATNTVSGNSPVGSWDCVMSGVRTGVATLVFSNDFTFTAYEVLVPKGPALPDTSAATGRGPNTGVGRSPSGTTNSGPSGTAIYGSDAVTNNWTFDEQGRVFGFWAETAGLTSCVTNILTNTVPPTTNIVCSELVNSVNFTGTVVPGRRLTLTCSTPLGKVIYRGVPTVQLADFSGNYIGTLKQKLPPVFNEMFTLIPTTAFTQYPNLYDIIGQGPGYAYLGRALIIKQGHIGIRDSIGPDLITAALDPVSVRAVTGGFNLNLGRGTLSGWDQPSGVFTNRVSFRVVKQ